MSILSDVKTLLNVSPDDDGFDTELILHINGVFSILRQLGVGPDSGFHITGNTETWANFMADTAKIEILKPYIFMKVKLVFDPPQSSTVMQAYKDAIAEAEWRLNAVSDYESEGD